jgi:hypothetical protein
MFTDSTFKTKDVINYINTNLNRHWEVVHNEQLVSSRTVRTWFNTIFNNAEQTDKEYRKMECECSQFVQLKKEK